MNDAFEQQWLSDLPSEWIEKRADFLCDPYRITVDPAAYEDDLVAHYSIPQVQLTGGPAIEFASDIGSTKLLVNEPMLLVSKLNPRKQTICIAEPHEEYVTLASSEFVAISSIAIDQRYAFFLWSSQKVTDRLSAIVQSATRSHQRVNPSDITKLPWKWPPLDVQRRIAGFLDEKTARIDALIAKKRALLDLLAEKRQALITRAVTQGLDPDVPRKPSGIDWLGEIPAHWIVADLGYRYEVQLGRMLNAERADGEHLKPYLRVNDVQWDEILVEDLPKMDFPPEAQAHYRLREGDLLVNEGGSYVGRSAIWRGELQECYYQKALHRLRPFDPASDTAEFLYFVMEMATRNGLFIAGGNQTTIDHLTAEKLRHYEFAFPPKEEQELIALALRTDTKEIGRASTMVTDSIGMLEQYRSALVTAAVTGQIEGLLESSNIVKTPARRDVPNAFKRATLAAHIADKLCDEPTFGRVKFQKVLHLCEMHAGALEAEGNYFRQAAGPLDSRMMHSVHSQLKKQGWFDIEERRGGRGYLYRRGAKIDAYRKHFDRYFQDRAGTIDDLLVLLAGMNTEQSEIVSTVYAAWNDLLLEGQDATPDRIVHLVLNEWAEEKRRIPEDRWRRAIDWMRAKSLIPRGKGAHTRQKKA